MGHPLSVGMDGMEVVPLPVVPLPGRAGAARLLPSRGSHRCAGLSHARRTCWLCWCVRFGGHPDTCGGGAVAGGVIRRPCGTMPHVDREPSWTDSTCATVQHWTALVPMRHCWMYPASRVYLRCLA